MAPTHPNNQHSVSHNAGDKQTHRNSVLSNALNPARDTAALPALTVTEEASSTRHSQFSTFNTLSGWLGGNSSAAGVERREASAQESAALLRPDSSRPHARNHHRTKSASSSSTVSSQPVIVRTYQGSRPSSRTRLPQNSSRRPNKTMSRSTRLPPAEDFSFNTILRAVEPEIQSAIDAIAEICARSRMSLADEHSAHIPPQGEIREGEPGYRGRQGPRIGYRNLERTLTAVPEASSSSERLAGGSKASSDSGTGKNSAYGSLKDIIAGRKGSQSSKADHDASFNASESTFVAETENGSIYKDLVAAKAPTDTQTLPSAALISSSTPSKQLSLDSSANIPVSTPAEVAVASHSPVAREPVPFIRSRSLSALSSWLPWPRSTSLLASSTSPAEAPRAEAQLKNLLRTCSSPDAKFMDNFG